MNFPDDLILQNQFPQPDSIAVIGSNFEISYSELRENVYKYSSHLKSIGIKEDEYVSILSENRPEFLFLVLGLWNIGAIPVPLNTRLTENEIEVQLNISKNKKIIIHNEIKKRLNFKESIEQIEFPFNFKSKNPDFVSSKLFDKTRTAVVIFTSGSTGTPKGVELSFNNLIKNAEIGNRVLDQGSTDRWLASLPFYHVGGFSIITRTLHYGAAIVIPDSLNNSDIGFAIENLKPTLASFVSTQLGRLIQNNIKPNPELKNVLLGGGFIDDNLINRAFENGWEITKVYGSSETSSFVTAATKSELKFKKASAGKALHPNEIKIIDKNGTTLPPGKSGEILVKSEAVMKGYLNNPAETNKKLLNGFYHTGDIGYIDEDGFLFVEARRSDLIISGGENVNPVEVEKEILKFPGIIECAVIGIKDETWGQKVAAAVILKDKNISENEIKEFLAKSLAGYKIPKVIKTIDSLPKTSLGKIEKEKVKKIF